MRDTTRPVPFWHAARSIFDLALDGMVWSRRSLLMAILLALPVVFALFYRGVLIAKIPPEVTPFDFYGYIVALYCVRNVLPLAALFYASALIADEVDGKTISYLLTRPILRASILVGKFAAYLVATLTLILPTLVITYFLLMTSRGLSGLGATVPDLFKDMGVASLSLLVYGALFALLGVVVKRPVIPGVLFLYIWELVANLPGYLPRFTITVYLRSLISHRPAQEGISEIFGQVLPTALCFEVLTTLTVVFLGLALWIFSRREFVLDQ
jgi:ABC-type transport system involved in multi-copper enzyme maturation permease subunit